MSGVDQFEIQATRDDRAFDAYAMVDWSSSSKPVRGSNSIWIASGSWCGRTFALDEPLNPATRMEAEGRLPEKIHQWAGKRILIGFDFPFGYPAGFAKALGLQDVGQSWRALHSHFAANVTDSPENKHKRDAFAEECNRRINGREAPGPFWGCTKSAASAALTTRRAFTFPHHGLEEWRVTEREAKKKVTTLSVWKLNCGVSVGGQTILGIKYLDELARTVDARRWPFEGWDVASEPGIWFAEIFPSLVDYPKWRAAYAKPRDRTQVQSCVRRAAKRDREGLLGDDFARPVLLDRDEKLAQQVEDEEGWILWV